MRNKHVILYDSWKRFQNKEIITGLTFSSIFFLCNFNIVTKLKLLEKNMEFETRTSTFKLKKKQMIYFQNKGFTFTLVCEN